MDRVQYYIGEILDNSIFVSATNIKKISELPFKAQVHVFPIDPGPNCNVFVYKVSNSICEKVFLIDSINHKQLRPNVFFVEDDGGNKLCMNCLMTNLMWEKPHVNYWYKPSHQLFSSIDGLRLTDLSWQELELGYEDKKTGTVVTRRILKPLKATMTILLDRYSRQILSEDQAVEMLYANPDLDISSICLEDVDKFNTASRTLHLDMILTQLDEITVDPDVYLHTNPRQLAYADKYKQLDVAKYLLDLCNTDAQLQRVGEELLLYSMNGTCLTR